MEDKLIEILERATGLEVYFLERPETVKECIVYTYSEKEFSSCDNDEDLTQYTIYINLYCENGLNKRKEQIKTALKENGFLKVGIPTAYISEELNLINQAFNYKYIEG